MTQVIRFPLKLAQPAESTVDNSGLSFRLALQAAWQHVHDGDPASARMTCAAAITVDQPLLARDPGLLLDTVTVLAAAHGFRAIERLLAATSGRCIRVEVGPVRARNGGHGGVERHTVSEACLRDPWLTRQWSEQLIGVHADS